MNPLDEWKLAGALLVLFTGTLGCSLSPVANAVQSKSAAGESENSGTSSRLRRALQVLERLVMSIGCGVMLTIGVVHIIPEAIESIEEVGWMTNDEGDQYPLAALIVLISIVVMFIVHVELHHLVDAAKQPATRMHVLEVGLVVHSVLIGYALGSAAEVPSARGLAIALIFHQLCEGFAMGSVINTAAADGPDGVGISTIHQVIMVAMFSLSTPVGVIIGKFTMPGEGVEVSPASLGAQGVLDSVAGGILICSSLVEFMPRLYGMCAGHEEAQQATEQDARRAANAGSVADAVVVESNTAAIELQAQSPALGAAFPMGTPSATTNNGLPTSGHTNSPTSSDVSHNSAGSGAWVRVQNHIGLLVGSGAMAVIAIWA